MADDSYQGAGFDPADGFELAEHIGETGMDTFAQELGAAIGQQLAAQQAPPPEVAQAAAVEQYARDIIARNPGLGTDEGARTAIGLAHHVAQSIGNPALVNDLGFVEAVHIAAEGAAAGVGRPQRTIVG